MKQIGELAEAKFLVEALKQGFHISKPYGDNQKYDFILDNGKKLFKIQLKSTTVKKCGVKQGYHIKVSHGSRNNHVGYSLSEVDFIICHLFIEDLWYILPISEVKELIGISLFPIDKDKSSKSKYDKYRNNWMLLNGI